MIPTMKTLADRLRWAREQAGLKQREMAPLLHVSRGAYSKYEIGQVEIPLGRLQDAARVLQVPIGWLLTGEEREADPVTTPPGLPDPAPPPNDAQAMTVDALLTNIQALTAIIQRNQELEAQRLANEQERIRLVEAKDAEKAVIDAEKAKHTAILSAQTKKLLAEDARHRTEQESHMIAAHERAQEMLQQFMAWAQFPHSADLPGTSEVEATPSGR